MSKRRNEADTATAAVDESASSDEPHSELGSDEEDGSEEAYTILSGDNREALWNELDEVLSERVAVVVIDNEAVGKETASAIRIGNIIHKTAVLTGLICLGSWPLRSYVRSSISNIWLPFGALSVVSALCYHLEWRNDPLSQYQIDVNGTEFPSLPVEDLVSKSPVVLVRRDDSVRKVLHNSIAICSLLYCGFHVVKLIRHS